MVGGSLEGRRTNGAMSKMWRALREKNIIFVTIACCLIFYFISPRFLSLDNVSAISRQIVPIGLIALGQFFVVVSGNIDLSMGTVAVLFSIVLGVFFGLTGGVTIGIVAVILGALALGFFNGYLISKIKYRPLLLPFRLCSWRKGCRVWLFHVDSKFFL